MGNETSYALPPTATEIYNRGVQDQIAGQTANARGYYIAALRLDPDLGGALGNLGGILAAEGRMDAAIACVRRYAARHPGDWGAQSNLGNLLWRTEQYEEAERALRRALKMAPDQFPIHHNLGLLLASRGQYALAIKHYDRALELKPGNPATLSDRAYACMAQGDVLSAMPDYEARWGVMAKLPVYDTPAPRWHGEDVAGKTVLVHHEQGYGDTFMFARYLPKLKERGANVYFACPPELERLMGLQPYIDKVVAAGEPFTAEPVDYQISLLSLPAPLRIGSFTNREPYLKLDQDYRPLAEPKRLSIGIAWSTGMVNTPTPGSMGHDGAKRRSYGLSRCLDIAALPGVQCYSLQVGEPAQDIYQIGAEALVEDMAPKLKDWLVTAALISQLDLVISPDTALANLAGALNVPCFMPLPHVTCWRWKSRPAWYSSVRPYRQETPGDWGPVFRRLTDAVADMAATRNS